LASDGDGGLVGVLLVGGGLSVGLILFAFLSLFKSNSLMAINL
jgi:hypothetical protein